MRPESVEPAPTRIPRVVKKALAIGAFAVVSLSLVACDEIDKCLEESRTENAADACLNRVLREAARESNEDDTHSHSVATTTTTDEQDNVKAPKVDKEPKGKTADPVSTLGTEPEPTTQQTQTEPTFFESGNDGSSGENHISESTESSQSQQSSDGSSESDHVKPPREDREAKADHSDG